jgi:transcriptional regulator with XRE-family HTH domain
VIPELRTVWNVETKDRVKALREALQMTQTRLAERAGHKWQRVYVSKIERGDNAATSYESREALAQGFGLTIPELVAYLQGKATLEETLPRCKPDAPGEAPAPAESKPAAPARPAPDEPTHPLVLALFDQFRPDRYPVPAFDATRRAVEETRHSLTDAANLGDLARDLLVAATQLYREGKALDAGSIYARAYTGRSPRAIAAAEARDEEMNRQADEDAKAAGFPEPLVDIGAMKKGAKK